MQNPEISSLVKTEKLINKTKISEFNIINDESSNFLKELKIFDERLNENLDNNQVQKLNSNFNKFILENSNEEYIFDDIIRNLDYPMINKSNSVCEVKNPIEVI